MSKTIANLNQTRKQTNNPYLLLYLWQHDKHAPIGGIKGLTEDSQGVIYEAQINMNVQKGREAFALVEEQQVGGSSYGYDPVQHYYTGDIRHLKEVTLHEVSVVSFPANPHARTLSVKSSTNTTASRIDELAYKMNASFAELERQLKSMDSAFPEFDWLKDAHEYQSETGQDITALLIDIQRRMR